MYKIPFVRAVSLITIVEAFRSSTSFLKSDTPFRRAKVCLFLVGAGELFSRPGRLNDICILIILVVFSRIA